MEQTNEKYAIGYALVKDNKILIAKNTYNNANGIPIIYGTYKDMEHMMLKEFVTFIRIQRIFRTTEIPMKIDGKVRIEPLSIYYVTQEEHYVLPPNAEEVKSGVYSDKKYVTYQEAEKMFFNNQLSEHSFTVIKKLLDEGVLK